MTTIKTKAQKKRDLKKEEFLQAFESSACNVSVSCKKVGISRNAFYEWKKNDPEFLQAVEDQNESLLDFAETMLYKGIKDGKTAELIFFLKTKGKKRGYIERIQTEDLTDREPIEVSIVLPKKKLNENQSDY